MDFFKIDLVVATPCFGGLVTQRYMQSALGLMQVASQAGFRASIELLGYDSLITRSRNALVARFLDKPEATHLFFIDADIGFGLEQVARMLRFDQDVVAGMYPLKQHDWARAVPGEPPETAALRYLGTPCEGTEARAVEGFVTGQYAGTGFMLIKRAVLERMVAAHPELRYRSAHTAAVPSRSPNQVALFDTMIDPETGEYLSEDYTFCRRWRALGGTLWLDTQGSLIHVGTQDFVGQPALRAFRARAELVG